MGSEDDKDSYLTLSAPPACTPINLNKLFKQTFMLCIQDSMLKQTDTIKARMFSGLCLYAAVL